MGRDSAAKTSANPQRQGLIAGLLAAVFFGLSAALIRVISGETSPLMIPALLYTGVALALLVVRAAVGRQQAESSVQRRDLAPPGGAHGAGGGSSAPFAWCRGSACCPTDRLRCC
jgi:hypothetical protein